MTGLEGVGANGHGEHSPRLRRRAGFAFAPGAGDAGQRGAAAADGAILSPMPGQIIAVEVRRARR